MTWLHHFHRAGFQLLSAINALRSACRVAPRFVVFSNLVASSLCDCNATAPNISHRTVHHCTNPHRLHTEAFFDKGPLRQAKQSALAKLVMNSSLRQDLPTSAPTSIPNSLTPLPPPAVRDATVTSQNVAHAGALRAVCDLTDTPPNPRSVSSTAPNSPRM